MQKRKAFKDINDVAKDMMADLSGIAPDGAYTLFTFACCVLIVQSGILAMQHCKCVVRWAVNQTLEFESEDAVVTVTCEAMDPEEEEVVKTTDRAKSSDPAAIKKAIKKEKAAKRKSADNQHHGKKLTKRKKKK